MENYEFQRRDDEYSEDVRSIKKARRGENIDNWLLDFRVPSLRSHALRHACPSIQKSWRKYFSELIAAEAKFLGISKALFFFRLLSKITSCHLRGRAEGASVGPVLNGTYANI